MSRRCNTKHDRRGPSHYPDRLRDRGVSRRSVRMIDFVHVGKHNDGLPGREPTVAEKIRAGILLAGSEVQDEQTE